MSHLMDLSSLLDFVTIVYHTVVLKEGVALKWYAPGVNPVAKKLKYFKDLLDPP